MHSDNVFKEAKLAVLHLVPRSSDRCACTYVMRLSCRVQSRPKTYFKIGLGRDYDGRSPQAQSCIIPLLHVIGDRSPLRSTRFRQLLCELNRKMKNFFLLCSLVTLSAAANDPAAEYMYGGK